MFNVKVVNTDKHSVSVCELELLQRSIASCWVQGFVIHNTQVIGPFLSADIHVVSTWIQKRTLLNLVVEGQSEHHFKSLYADFTHIPDEMQ